MGSIVSTDGRPIIYVVVNERVSPSGIWLKMANETADPMAFIRTGDLHVGTSALPEICFPTGEVFSRLSKSGKDYVVRHVSGAMLMTIQGDFVAKQMHATGPYGNDICFTQPCVIDMDNSPRAAYYEVRVAPGVDAGLMLCALLAIEKAEV